jgi:hypothetical protein
MADVKKILEGLLEELTTLGKSTFENAKVDAQNDVIAFYNANKQSLEDWSKQLINGDIDKDNFASLVRGLKDNLLLAALEKEGETLVNLDKFRTQVFNTILSTIISKI